MIALEIFTNITMCSGVRKEVANVADTTSALQRASVFTTRQGGGSMPSTFRLTANPLAILHVKLYIIMHRCPMTSQPSGGIHMRRCIICITFLILSSLNAFAVDFFAHRNGLWSIEPTKKMKRWIIIHDMESSVNNRVYHIEVIGRAHDAPAWQVERLVRHMAITEKALKASVKKPLTSGAVYPESFDSAYASWHLENNGRGGVICDTTVRECMPGNAPDGQK